MRRRWLPFFFCIFGAACQSPHEGIWLVQLFQPEYEPGTYECTENFRNAFCTGQGEVPNTEWTYSQDLTETPELLYAQVVDGPGGESYLTVREEIYIGTREGKTTTFTWTHSEVQDNLAEHENNYEYRILSTQTETTTMTLTRKGSTFSGEMVLDFIDEFNWFETDEWDEFSTGVPLGSIPSNEYLEEEDLDGALNLPANRDCEGNPCSLTVINPYTLTRQVSGTRTAYPTDAFGGVYTSGQEPGLAEDR